MSAPGMALVVFGCVAGAGLAGLALGRRLPDHHLDADSRDVVRLVMGFCDRIQALVPQTDAQRSARDRAAELAGRIAATRVLMTQDPDGSIPLPFLLVLGSWLVIMFASFGLFARANATVVTTLVAGAVSVAGAVFMILELDRPLDGVMRLSAGPLRHALDMVGR